MSALTANTPRAFEVGDSNNLPIKASTEIFLGAAVGMTAGYARQLVAGDIFAGFAEGHVNNSVATDGANTIPVRQRGLIQLAVTSVAVTDIGKAVYASDSATFTLTATSNSRVGSVYRFISTGVCIVKFDTLKPTSLSSITAVTFGTNIAAKTAASLLTDSSATNPSDSQFNQLAKDLGSKINEILAAI